MFEMQIRWLHFYSPMPFTVFLFWYCFFFCIVLVTHLAFGPWPINHWPEPIHVCQIFLFPLLGMAYFTVHLGWPLRLIFLQSSGTLDPFELSPHYLILYCHTKLSTKNWTLLVTLSGYKINHSHQRNKIFQKYIEAYLLQSGSFTTI